MTKHPHVNENETPGNLPALGAETRFKTTFGTAWVVGVGIAGAAIWGTIVYLDVQTLKKHDEENTAEIKQMHNEVSRIMWILDPPMSRPVISQKANPTISGP
jgi:hypothetical protein